METKYLTVAEAAKILKVKHNTIRDWLKAGNLKGSKIGRLWRIERTDIDDFVTRGGQR